MLILLGGFRGCGKRELAQELARMTGFHWYDTERHRTRMRVTTPRGITERLQEIHTDEERMFFLRRVVQDFRMLSKLHDGVVMDYPLHRAIPRDFILKNAREYFPSVEFIWVEGDHKGTAERMRPVSEDARVHERRVRAREREIREYEPPVRMPHTFVYTGNVREEAARLWKLISG